MTNKVVKRYYFTLLYYVILTYISFSELLCMSSSKNEDLTLKGYDVGHLEYWGNSDVL